MLKVFTIVFSCLLTFSASAELYLQNLERLENGEVVAEMVYFRCSALPAEAFSFGVNNQMMGFGVSAPVLKVDYQSGLYRDCKGPAGKKTVELNLGELADGIYIQNPSVISI